MSNRNLLLIILAATALLVGVFLYYQDQMTKRYDWSESSWLKRSYSEASDQPYGTMVTHRLLEHYFPNHPLKDLKQSIARELPIDSSGASNFVFVGESMVLDSVSKKHLLDFVNAGNTVLIASKGLPGDLASALYGTGCNGVQPEQYATHEDSLAQLSLTNPTLPAHYTFNFAVQNKVQPYDWNYFNTPFLCNIQPVTAIGRLNDSLVNFISFQYGRGRFLLHSNPIVFSNYSMLKPAGRSYVEGILSWLHEGNIYWDAVSRLPTDDKKEEANPLEYILRQPALAWAWYLLVALALIWVVFAGKRRQRAIPILPQNENSSYEFIGTIAHLQFKARNYRGQCVQNMKLFLAQIRERYGFSVVFDPESTMPKTDEAFFKRLSAVSEVPETKIQGIFTQYTNCVRYEPNEGMMTDLHFEMEDFWKRAR
jgi:hypothetical protein